MAMGQDLRRLALALEGTVAAPHFDRTAFKAARTYATLAADGRSVNIRFTPEQQQFKCLLAPDTFRPLANAWGRQGWTEVTLAAIRPAELKDALEAAWAGAQPKPKARRSKKPAV